MKDKKERKSKGEKKGERKRGDGRNKGLPGRPLLLLQLWCQMAMLDWSVLALHDLCPFFSLYFSWMPKPLPFYIVLSPSVLFDLMGFQREAISSFWILSHFIIIFFHFIIVLPFLFFSFFHYYYYHLFFIVLHLRAELRSNMLKKLFFIMLFLAFHA